MQNSKGYTLPIILFLIIAVAVLFIFIARNLTKSSSQLLPQLSHQTQTLKSTDYVKVSGKAELLKENLNLMVVGRDVVEEQRASEQNFVDKTKYYKAGTYSEGKYKGYTRVIALRPYNNMIGYQDYVFATKDFKTYVLNGDPKKFDPNKKPEELTYEDYLYELDSTKVKSVDMLPPTVPQELPLNDKYGLHLERWNALLVTQPRYDELEKLSLTTEIPQAEMLPSPNKDFLLFADRDENPPTELAKYLDGKTTGVLVMDGSGVIYRFAQTTAQKNNEFEQKLKDYEKAEAEFEKRTAEINKQAEEYKAKTGQDLVTQDYPNYPDVPRTPSFAFEKNDLRDMILSSNNYYEHYRNAFPAPCGQDVNTYVIQNISDQEQDLQKVGTVDGIDIYLLKDAYHPIMKIAYDLKKKPNDELAKEYNWTEDKYFHRVPDFNTYVGQKPLFFMKDYWGRLIVMQEDNFTITGGCGKPVIYLYPQQTTDVSLNFSAPMRLDTQIPAYGDGWKVKANPDGTLVDLHPELTDCSRIENTFGSEYARTACEKNEYPYIYWAGQSYASNYPKVNFGWIVGSGEVESLLKTKLTEIGLTEKEQNDMLEYWLPQIEKHNAPYYRISLLQNSELNQLFPMEVSPKPDSIIRVFLDFLPLNSASEVNVSDQKIEHFDRNGFTLVEWGGLHR